MRDTIRNWQAYKKTFRTEPNLFDFARTGDLRGLADILTDMPEVDINAKNNRGYSILMLAVYNGQHDFCEALIRCGADVNSIDCVGNTLLMGSAFKGDLAMVKLLLNYGADISLMNKSKMTVRDWALMFKRTEITAFLDSRFTLQESPSMITNIYRFIKLSFYMLRAKVKW